MINLLDKDLQFQETDVTTISLPLRTEQDFWGVMFLELEPLISLNSSVISNSFTNENTNFLQILHPYTNTHNEGIGKVMMELEKHEDNGFKISSDPRYIEKVIELQNRIYVSQEAISDEFEFWFE